MSPWLGRLGNHALRWRLKIKFNFILYLTLSYIIDIVEAMLVFPSGEISPLWEISLFLI